MNKALQAVKSIASKISTRVSPVATKVSSKLSVVITKAADTKIGKFIIRNRPDATARGIVVTIAVAGEVLARIFRGGTPLRNLRKAFTDFRGMPTRAFDFVLQVCLNLASAAYTWYFLVFTGPTAVTVVAWTLYIGALIYGMEKISGRQGRVGNFVLSLGSAMVKGYIRLAFAGTRIYGYRPHWLKAKLADADVRYARKVLLRQERKAELAAARGDEVVEQAAEVLAPEPQLTEQEKARLETSWKGAWERVQGLWAAGTQTFNEALQVTEEVMETAKERTEAEEVDQAAAELTALIKETPEVAYDSAKADKDRVHVHINGSAARMQPRLYGKELADDVAKQPLATEVKVSFRKVLPRLLREAGVVGKELTWLLQAYDSRMSELVSA